MTKHGALNIGGMLLLPAAAVLGAMIATATGVWEAYTATYVWVFVLNCIISVPAGLFSWLMLRRSTGDKPRLIAILPTLVTATVGAIWYLFRALFPDPAVAGTEYLGAPQYLMIIMLGVTFLVLVLRLTRVVPRAA